MKISKALAVSFLALGFGLLSSSTARAEVHLTIQNGRVTLVAKDATLRQILTEWARVGQTKIVNGERVPGGALTLQLTDVPELQALDILLRSLSGYVAAPRATSIANASLFDRILIIPTVPPPVSAAVNGPPPPTFQQPTFQPPGMPVGFPQQAGGLPMPDDQEDDRSPNRNPVFISPQPQVTNPMVQGGMPMVTPGGMAPPPGPLLLPNSPAPSTPQSSPYTTTPGASTSPAGGVSVPGMIVPAPQQPGQPVVQPKKPGGN